LRERASRHDHPDSLAGPLYAANPAQDSMQRNGAVVVRSRIASRNDAPLGSTTFDADDSVDDGGVKAAVIENYVAGLDRICSDGLEGNHVAVFDGGPHAGPAHSQLDWQSPRQKLAGLFQKVGRL